MSDDNIDNDELLPSKTARKRAATAAQDLGKRLAQLKPEQLQALDLPDRLRAAIEDYQRFPSHGARRRQLQFVGKLMREADAEAIEQELDRLEGQSASARYEFAQLEKWRDALLGDTDAMTRFIAEHPQVERQKLRQLVKKALSANNETQHKTAARELFRFLRETVQDDHA